MAAPIAPTASGGSHRRQLVLKSKSLPGKTRGKQHQISVYLEPETLRRLRALCEQTGAPMTHFVREGVELVIAKYDRPPSSPKRAKESRK